MALPSGFVFVTFVVNGLGVLSSLSDFEELESTTSSFAVRRRLAGGGDAERPACRAGLGLGSGLRVVAVLALRLANPFDDLTGATLSSKADTLSSSLMRQLALFNQRCNLAKTVGRGMLLEDSSTTFVETIPIFGAGALSSLLDPVFDT